MSSKEEEVAFFRADDGTVYKAVQAPNGVISRLTELVREVENQPLLDETLLSSTTESQSVMSSLVAEIFLRDSFYWFGAFIVSFVVASIYEDDVPPFPSKIFLLLLQISLLVAFTGYALILGKRVPVRGLAFSFFLGGLLLAGVLCTAEKGTTQFARACLIQWAMSLGTVLGSFRSTWRSAEVDAAVSTAAAGTRCKMALAHSEILAWLAGWSFASWFIGVLSEPRLASAVIAFAPIVPCIAYRYLWITHLVVASRQYRADEATVAWYDFYAEPVRSCFRLVQRLRPSPDTTPPLTQ